MADFAVNLVAAFCLVGPLLVIPFIVGANLLRSFADDPLCKLASVFTLKPIVASALLALLLLNPWIKADPGQAAPWSVLPGAGLTVLIVWYFRHLYIPTTPLAYLFLAADFLRWGNTYVLLRSLNPPPLDFSPEVAPVFWISLLAACVLPSAYAAMAWFVVNVRRTRRRMTRREPPAVPVV